MVRVAYTIRRVGRRPWQANAIEGKGTMPEVGDLAPDFTLRGANGAEVRLSDLRGAKRALLIFYPKDMTSG